MKFYVITNTRGSVEDCATSLREAKRIGREICDGVYDVDMIETPAPSRELVRMLLAEHGGYAIESRRIIENGKPYDGTAGIE